ncbi:DNA-binding transcriptional regulator, MarR family [Sporobacter termitidis DSM 10068]|uniref:DNA-binding transcriptional regulator, MarR family n=1 Tax=Sporobacter termitidis DSM 10068 TaxID=1123282 RepID=A0A1M5YN18_9FIRM|nr:MarR family winged helix-turn-helix transcriptional regulator [Sporobacter termitidis]SHI13340.1 DNA-binding transcriptional regulator, MarR family [Sporobacter termitidis DSM 10068]
MTRQQKPEKAPSPCNCLNLRRASSAMTKIYDAYLAPCGISIAQFSLFRHLRQLGPVSVSALAEKIRLDRTTLVRNLRPLEKAGLVVDISPRSARSRELELTEKGREKLGEAEKLWDGAQRHIEEALGKDNIALLTELLTRIENIR